MVKGIKNISKFHVFSSGALDCLPLLPTAVILLCSLSWGHRNINAQYNTEEAIANYDSIGA